MLNLTELLDSCINMTEKQRSQEDVSRGSQNLVETFEGNTEEMGEFIQSSELPKGTTMSYFILHGAGCHMRKRTALSWIKARNQWEHGRKIHPELLRSERMS